MARIAILTAALLVWLTPASSRATFHTSLISEVMLGVNGDPTVQYVEIRVSAGTASGVKGSVLTAFDCTGMSHVVLLTVPDNVANGGADVHWLMATTNFAAAAGITPDFTWDPAASGNIYPTCGMVCWGGRGSGPPLMPDPSNPNNYVDCVGYGGYIGPTKMDNHDGTPVSGLATGLPPGDGTASLTRMTSTESNLADFALAAPTPTNNGGEVGAFGSTTTTMVAQSTTTAPATTSSTTTMMPTTTASTSRTSTSTSTTAPVPSSPTSTTMLPPDTACGASTIAACDDGDACSVDHCLEGTGCVHDPVVGPQDLFRVGPACVGEPVPSPVGQQYARGCGLVVGARGQPPAKRKKLLAKATRTFNRAAKMAKRAGTRRKAPISGDCAAALRAVLGGARDQAERAKSGL